MSSSLHIENPVGGSFSSQYTLVWKPESRRPVLSSHCADVHPQSWSRSSWITFPLSSWNNQKELKLSELITMGEFKPVKNENSKCVLSVMAPEFSMKSFLENWTGSDVITGSFSLTLFCILTGCCGHLFAVCGVSEAQWQPLQLPCPYCIFTF